MNPRAALAFAVLMFLAPAAHAQEASAGQEGLRAAPVTHVDVQQLPLMDSTPAFDADKATDKYLARIGGEARAKSDAYYEGGYILQLADLLYGLAVAGLLLWLGLSTRIRDWATDRTRSRTGQVLIYVAVYTVIVTAATFPLTVYEGFFREHAYGLSNQTFLAWFGDFATAFAVSLTGALIVLPLL